MVSHVNPTRMGPCTTGPQNLKQQKHRKGANKHRGKAGFIACTKYSHLSFEGKRKSGLATLYIGTQQLGSELLTFRVEAA